MDAHHTFLAALQAHAALARRNQLAADEVRTLGAVLGIEEGKLMEAVEILAKDGFIHLKWGGTITLPQRDKPTSAALGGDHLGGTFYGPVTLIHGDNAHIDTRGSGHSARYVTQAERAPEEAVGAIAAAIVELHKQVAELDTRDADQAKEIETTARTTLEEARKDNLDLPSLRLHLQKLTNLVDDLGKLSSATGKLDPALAAIRKAGEMLWHWVSSIAQ